MAHDVDKGLDGTTAEEREVVAGDLPAFDVADAVEAEELRLRCSESGVAEPVAEEPPHDRQEVEVSVVRWRGAARQPEPGDEQSKPRPL